MSAARLEGAALFLVDDHHASSLRYRQRVRSASPGCGARLSDGFARRDDFSRGKLCWPALGLSPRYSGKTSAPDRSGGVCLLFVFASAKVEQAAYPTTQFSY